jgi:hypothetical protein
VLSIWTLPSRKNFKILPWKNCTHWEAALADPQSKAYPQVQFLLTLDPLLPIPYCLLPISDIFVYFWLNRSEKQTGIEVFDKVYQFDYYLYISS